MGVSTASAGTWYSCSVTEQSLVVLQGTAEAAWVSLNDSMNPRLFPSSSSDKDFLRGTTVDEWIYVLLAGTWSGEENNFKYKYLEKICSLTPQSRWSISLNWQGFFYWVTAWKDWGINPRTISIKLAMWWWNMKMSSWDQESWEMNMTSFNFIGNWSCLDSKELSGS